MMRTTCDQQWMCTVCVLSRSENIRCLSCCCVTWETRWVTLTAVIHLTKVTRCTHTGINTTLSLTITNTLLHILTATSMQHLIIRLYKHFLQCAFNKRCDPLLVQLDFEFFMSKQSIDDISDSKCYFDIQRISRKSWPFSPNFNLISISYCNDHRT